MPGKVSGLNPFFAILGFNLHFCADFTIFIQVKIFCAYLKKANILLFSFQIQMAQSFEPRNQKERVVT